LPPRGRHGYSLEQQQWDEKVAPVSSHELKDPGLPACLFCRGRKGSIGNIGIDPRVIGITVVTIVLGNPPVPADAEQQVPEE
jgi:hypothetical protein